MKRKLPLMLAVLLLLAVAYSPSAHAAAGGLPSRERNDGEIDIDEDGVPLIELPAATVTAEVTVGADGAAAAELTTDQLLGAVGAVVSGDAVRITVAAAAEAGTVSAVLPREALEAVVEQTDAELEIVTNVGRMSLPNAAVASIVEQAGGEDVAFRMARQTVELGRELLEEVLGDAMDVAEDRIRNGSVTEIDILSGGRSITSWEGGAVTLDLPAGSGNFEENKGYRVIQISGDRTRTEHTGCCVTGGEGLYVEISVTHLSAFVVLADAVEENMAGGSVPMVASPLAAQVDGGSGNSTGGSNIAYVCFAAAGLVLAAGAVGGIALKRRQRF